MSMPKGYNAETGTMTFSLALDEMKAGRKVRRRCWRQGRYLHILKGVMRDEEGYPNSIIETGILLADDWETVL